MSDDAPKGSSTSIPGYEIERELGRGGFAVVYRSNQPKLRRTVALKVLTNVDPSDEEAKRRFEAECQAIGSLSWHPHVVTVYDAGATDDGLPFLAMEYLPSGSLQAKLGDHGRAPYEEVLRVAVQMSDALAAAHQAGILHRDIKPANVLTSRIGDYKLADFGIARFGDSQRTATGVITGTVAYTAPEVLRGSRASTASDLYALGAMLCAVASGRTPFVKDADESVVAIMYRVNTEDPPPLAEFDVPDDVALLIHTLMDKDPEKRPASALEVAQWAQHLQEQRGIQSVPLHTDPDLEPGLPAAALAAGAAALGVGRAAAAGAGPAGVVGAAPPPATTPPPVAGAVGTPVPGSYPATPAPGGAQWGVGTPAPTAFTTPPPSASYTQPAYQAPTTGYTPTGAYPPATGTYGAAPASGGGSSTGRIVAIAAVIALIVVALIIAIAAVAGGGDNGAAGDTTTTAEDDDTTTGEDDDPTTTEGTTSTTEDTTTTTEGTTTTQDGEPGGYPQTIRDNFVDTCTAGGGTPAACTCIIDGLEEILTLEEFIDLDQMLADDPDASLPSEVTAVFVSCAS